MELGNLAEEREAEDKEDSSDSNLSRSVEQLSLDKCFLNRITN